MTTDEIIASSTAVVGNGTAILVKSVFAFFPLLLEVGIPLGLLWGAYYWFMHRKGRT